MTEQEFEKLVDKDKYQVFILQSQATFPLSFAVHPWVVFNKKGIISRYEIKHSINSDGTYLYINTQPPFQGLPLVWPINKFFQKARLLKMIEGNENSRVKDLIDLIENSKEKYPYLNKYSFIGANCATYVAWLIKDFPEIEIILPWNAVGKNYKQNPH